MNAFRPKPGSILACAILCTLAFVCASARQGEAASRTSASSLTTGARTKVSAGCFHTCAALPSGAVKCWGFNRDGELGDGTNDDSSKPVTVKGIDGRGAKAIAVSAGGTSMFAHVSHSCAVLSGGAVMCWGSNFKGQLGNGTHQSSNEPVRVSGIANAVSISAGGAHTCAVLADGSVVCWGANWSGELGNGTTQDSSTPTPVVGISTAVAASAGAFHTCALLSSGKVECWGSNRDGQLGNGTTKNSLVPVTVKKLSNAKQISVGLGDMFSCALVSTGRVKCWGNNADDTLGVDRLREKAWIHKTPVTVRRISHAVSVDAGGYHACAVLKGGKAACWGDPGAAAGVTGDLKVLGKRGGVDVSLAVGVVGISRARSVSAGGYHTCVVLSNQTVECWGAGFYGQLGGGDPGQRLRPVPVKKIRNARSVSAGGYRTCASLSSGKVECWGVSWKGAGDSSATRVPKLMRGASKALSVSAGYSSACALRSERSVQCWGTNSSGQFGIGGFHGSGARVVRARRWNGATQISVSHSFTCARFAGGKVKCAGKDESGQLGRGPRSDPTPVPVRVGGVSKAKSVSAGDAHACALISGGTIECWGADPHGQLGNGTTSESSTAMPVAGISGAVQVSAGDAHTCALLFDHTIECWGANGSGQLGDGTTKDSPKPVTASGISNARSVSAGRGFTCAVLTSGQIKCWGDNVRGMLGNDSTDNSSTPVFVKGIGDARSVSAGNSHACALISHGKIKCWGWAALGQLGDGSKVEPGVPVRAIGIP